ncbi:hypothetical protein Q5P01_019054 [Channa striata]|uniref:Uncharacterized protein n=1 Tax=Channa striata TaxID=64152 RepID=A0AA88M0S8_CHASR|nr:hypothetical protein Q5P01_019054 [Channa striata]
MLWLGLSKTEAAWEKLLINNCCVAERNRKQRLKVDEEDSAASGNEAGQRCTEVKAANANEEEPLSLEVFQNFTLCHSIWTRNENIGQVGRTSSCALEDTQLQSRGHLGASLPQELYFQIH